jgi:DNA ligase D-like protein (predicted polymerase)
VAKESGNKVLSIEGREVQITNPTKFYFSSQAKVSKLELVQYYLSVAPGALAGIRDRPIVLKRFVNGAEAEAFYQKRAPEKRPAWLRTVTLSFPSGRTAEEIVVDDAAGLAWIVNLGCIELHPHPVRSGDLDHPDELRIDLDPIPGVSWDDVRRVALEVQGFLDGVGLRGWPKTSGSRGMRECTHRTALDVHATSTCGGCPIASGRAPGPNTGQFEMVEGRASWRLS